MNNFTIKELKHISYLISSVPMDDFSLLYKIQSMIESHKDGSWNTRKIAESHLRKAESLISHAMCLLGMEDE